MSCISKITNTSRLAHLQNLSLASIARARQITRQIIHQTTHASQIARTSKITRLFLAFTLFFGIGFIASGCKSDELVVATAAEFRPFEFIDGDDFSGIDIDIAREIGKRLEKKVVFKDMKFDSVIMAINSGSVDMGISGLTINPTREKIVNFSTPYYSASQVVIIKGGDSRFEGLQSAQEIDEKIDSINGLKIGVQIGATGAFYANGDKDWGFGGFKNAVVKGFTNGALATLALENNQVDIVIIDEKPAQMLTKARQNLKVLPHALTQEKYAIAVSKSKPELLAQINEILAQMQNDGTLEAIFAKYLQ
ncbi:MULTISPECIES: transporter substrate-binding domain-containing protein [unclassified Helicobacter]|uniref:transporter substrate-binding domain-containing protein n=1 Tax=unclassified Helicobacter TaxID=2593540 RepID=UPI000CF016C0|nr:MULTISPECIES: transporter substrate-binding domain-containing protein [unclassified Helicobacter]